MQHHWFFVVLLSFITISSWTQRTDGRAESVGRECRKLAASPEAAQDCWRTMFIQTARTQGVNSALSTLSQIKDGDIAVASECHVYAHAIGEIAYQRLEQKKLGRVTGNTSLCNFGYFHGFMQEYVSHRKDLAAAQQVCDREPGAKPAVRNRERSPQCYHGIGHGLVYGYAVVGKPDEETVVAKAIADCDALVPELDTRRAECFNGVFGGIAALYFTLHGFSYRMRPNDPFWLCRSQPEHLQKYCYDELVPPLFAMTGYDFLAAGRWINTIPDKKIRRIAMEHLGWMPSHRGFIEKANYTEMVHACQAFGGEEGTHCIGGMAKSLVSTGPALDAIQRAVEFCEFDGLLSNEKDYCRNAIVDQIHYANEGKKREDMCAMLAQVSDLRLRCE